MNGINKFILLYKLCCNLITFTKQNQTTTNMRSNDDNNKRRRRRQTKNVKQIWNSGKMR